jgi:hypothetical protein
VHAKPHHKLTLVLLEFVLYISAPEVICDLALRIPYLPSSLLIFMTMGRPNIIFGAATFGMGFDDPQAVSEVLDFLKKHDIHHIDTAGRYPPLNPGLSEILLGQADAAQKGFVLDTKILAGPGDGSGELAKSAIGKSLSTSLQRLKVDSVRIRAKTAERKDRLLTKTRSTSCIAIAQIQKHLSWSRHLH